MNIILLSGGSGKRLWPLSNDVRSKQFIKLFKNGDTYESMVQRVYRQLKKVDENSNITIATSKTQVSVIHNQLGDNVSVSVEPCRRDTFPAIALSTAYLHYVKNVSLDDSVVVCPVDPYVEDAYFECIKDIYEYSCTGQSNLTLMGIAPTEPSEKFGYIMPKTNGQISQVDSFKEKPSVELAKEYIEKGGLWNGGVFAYKIGYLLDKAHELIDFTDYYDLFNKYDTLTKISFDYAVVEKEKNISVIKYKGMWEDLGTWNTFAKAMSENSIGNVILDDYCQNTQVINELDLPILCMGLKDMIVSASADGILVSDKDRSVDIKEYVNSIQQPIMFAEKSWGEYKVIDVEDESLTIKVSLKKGNKMNYHSHQYRDEVWAIINGVGIATVNDRDYVLNSGDTIKLPRNCKHTIFAETDLQLIEVQSGKDISKKDKIKY